MFEKICELLADKFDVDTASMTMDTKIKENLNRIMAERCHKPLEQVMQDTERDNFMSAEEARAYGLIDRVITHRE